MTEKYMTIDARYKPTSREVEVRPTRDTSDEITDDKEAFTLMYNRLKPIAIELAKKYEKSLELKLTLRG